jgi:hypothetical protein
MAWSSEQRQGERVEEEDGQENKSENEKKELE